MEDVAMSDAAADRPRDVRPSQQQQPPRLRRRSLLRSAPPAAPPKRTSLPAAATRPGASWAGRLHVPRHPADAVARVWQVRWPDAGRVEFVERRPAGESGASSSSSVTLQGLWDELWRAVDAVMSWQGAKGVATHRAVMLTRAGRYGLAPRVGRPADVCAVPMGVGVPFVLRKGGQVEGGGSVAAGGQRRAVGIDWSERPLSRPDERRGV